MAQTITYNELTALDRVYTTTGGGVTFSGNLNATTAFNYFSNSAVVNDAIYFGMSAVPQNFQNFSFSIGTALVASAITVAWEYYNGSAWTALSGLTDNTNAFRNTGTRTVTYTQPTNWASNTVNSVSGRWIRCRITAVTSITNGGANITTVVRAGNLAVTLSNPGATTATFLAACYTADVAGGWGVITNPSTGVYIFNCHFYLGYSTDASITTATDNNKAWIINGLIRTPKAYNIIELGSIVSSTDKTSNNGVYLQSNATLYGSFADSQAGNTKWKLYSCSLNSRIYPLQVGWNNIFNKNLFHSNLDGTLEIYNSQLGQFDFVGSSCTSGAVVNGIISSGVTSTQGALRLNYAEYVKGIKMKGNTYVGGSWSGGVTNEDKDYVGISPNIPLLRTNPTGAFYWLGPGSNVSNPVSAQFGEEYAVDITVVDSSNTAISGASLTLTDSAGLDSAFVEKGRVTNTPSYNSTTFTADTNVWSVGDYARYGNENVLITSGTYPNFVVSRSQRGTVARTQPSRQVQKLYPVMTSNGSGVFEQMLVETNTYQWASGSNPGVTAVLTRGPFDMKIYKYGFLEYTSALDITADVVSSIGLTVDSVIVKNYATAGAITGISINHSTETITVTGTVSSRDLYDYVHYDHAQGVNPKYTIPVTSTDGINFACSYDLDIGATGAITGSGTMDLGSKTLTITSGGSISLITTDVSGTYVSVVLTGMTAGSRVQLYNLDTSTELYNAVVAGTSLTFPYTYTTDVNLRIRIMYVSGTNADLFYEETRVISNTGLSVSITPVVDSVYVSNAVNGSTITTVTIDDTALKCEVDTGTISCADIYAYETYWLGTLAGIRDEGRFIEAVDNANYKVFDFLIKNVSSPSVPLIITGGFLVDGVTGSADVYDNTGGSIFPQPTHVVAYATSGGSGGATAAEVWSYATRRLSSSGISDITTGLATETNATANKEEIIAKKPKLLVGGKIII